MIMGRLRAGLSGTAALGVLGGVPVALTRFGGLPSPSSLRLAIALRWVSPHLGLQLAGLVAWIAYAYLLAWVALEVVGSLRDRTSIRRPPAWLRPLTARLAGLVLITLGRVSLPSAPTSLGQPPAALAMAPAHLAASVTWSPPAGPGLARHLVVAGDNLWDLAEDYYGHGSAWREIWAANRAVVSDPREIFPGQLLTIPPSTPTEAGDYVVAPGDSLWSIAEAHLGAGEDWPALWEANRDRPEGDDAELEDPSLIRPGWEIVIPASGPGPAALGTPGAPATAPGSSERPAPAPGTPAAQAPSPNTLAQDRGGDSYPPSSEVGPVAPNGSAGANPTAPLGTPVEPRSGNGAVTVTPAHAAEWEVVGLLGAAGTLLAVGIGGAVFRRRRRRQLQLPKQAPPPPPPELDELRAEVAAGADTDHASRLRQALCEVADSLAQRRSDVRPRVVQISDQRVEVLLSRAVLPVPRGWRPEASGSAWVLDGAHLDIAEDGASPCPALVSLGRPDAGAQVYLDLEAEGVVALTGEADAVTDLARSWVLELATSPVAGGVSVVVVGADLLGESGAWERVRRVEAWAEVAEDAIAWVEQSRALLAANRWPTPLAGRLSTRRTDDLSPLVLVLGEAPDDERFETLCQAVLVDPVAVSVVVVGGEVEGATRIEVGGGKLAIPSLGLVCRAQAVSSATAEQVSDLLEDASQLPAQLELIPPEVPRPPVTVGPPGEAYQDPPYEVLVRLLGDIGVIGGKTILKPKQTAVFVHIALHAPVASEVVEDAVWVAPTLTRHKRLANTVSECRAALGATHLPISTDGRYRVGPGVKTDLELFERRVAYAGTQDDEAAVETLRGALGLVEGPVFTYRNADRGSYVWVDLGNWHSTWEPKVSQVAEDLAQRCLDLGDLDGAEWAALRGLNASAAHTGLTKLLMQTYLARGEARAAEQVFESHQSALEQLDLDEVDPDLVEFYREACRSRKAEAS